nr:interleukin-1 receptor accessory protein-like 1 [Leptinotarsa decemlineata]
MWRYTVTLFDYCFNGCFFFRLKDDKLYPWALEISSLILVPESANQTIYTQSLSEKDAGNYTCVLKNDTVIHSHTIHLRVFEKVPDDPKITYISRDTITAVGQSLRLFCEAFAGEVDLPDAHSEAYWKKISANNSIYDVPSYAQQLKIDREDGQTFGTYLMIDELSKEDFGTYVCTISKPGNTIERFVSVIEKVDEVEYLNPNPVPVVKMILIMSAVLFSGLALIVLYLNFGLKVQVRMKDAFSPLEENDGKERDAMIVFAPQDSDVALGVLLPTLQDRFNYKCVSKELTTSVSMWYTQLKEEAQKCRRIIAVLSPTLLKENWECSQILEALRQLRSLGPQLICVSLKELPKNENEVKNAQGETLAALSRSLGVILWERKQDQRFWYSLRLRLPPKRNEALSEHQTSSDCLDNLV